MRTPISLPRVHETVIHMLAEAAAVAPNAVALQCDSDTLTYAEYASCVAVLARWIATRLGERQRVALIAGNSVQMAVTMLAIQAANAQVVPVNPAYTSRELAEILQDADPALVLCDINVCERVKNVLAHLPIQSTCLSLDQADLSLAHLKRHPMSSLPLPMPGADDLASLQYTGGTTGRSKGVEITHGQICVNVSQREFALPTRPDQEVILCAMPLFHVFAIAMCLHLGMYCRGRLVILREYHATDTLGAIDSHRVTILPAGPTVFRGLLAHPCFRSTSFGSLRVTFSGSAPLPSAIMEAWERGTSTRILEGYGQTEAGPVISYVSADDNPNSGSVGKPLILTEVHIVDMDTGERILPNGDPGEIRVRGPQVMSGYRNRPTETAAVLRNGWLYTGDIGFIDAAGYLHISGRKKEMAIVGGYNVFPREVEEVLCNHPEIQEAAALGVPDNYRGEVIAACVVLSKGSSLTATALQEYCAERLASYKIPCFIDFNSSLPRTSLGKIDKIKLLHQLFTPSTKKLAKRIKEGSTL